MAPLRSIVFTVTNDLTYDQRMGRICATLQRNGWTVTLVGFMKKRSVKLEEKPYQQIRLRPFFKKGKLFYFEYNIRLFLFLLMRKYQIYGGIDLDTLWPVWLNAQLKRGTCVYDAHEYFTELPEIVDRPLIKKIWLHTERTLLPKIKWNYTVGYAIAETLSTKYHQPYAVIRNVPELMEDSTHLTHENYIIYQGALNTGRGLEALMAAMALINSQLYIAGEGDLSEPLRAYAAALPHASKIRFLGYVRPAALKSYTQRAAVGVNFIENKGLSYYYSLSNKFFDYIHAALPQVTMDFPEYKRLNDEYDVAVLINDLKPETIAGAINRLMEDQQLYDRLRLNALKARNFLNWQKEEQKLIEFYRRFE